MVGRLAWCGQGEPKPEKSNPNCFSPSLLSASHLVRNTGIGPVLPPWQGGVLPLYEFRIYEISGDAESLQGHIIAVIR